MFKSLFKIISILLFSILISCSQDYTPKPEGYFRIDLPKRQYKKYRSNSCSYSFEYPVYSNILLDTVALSEPCWVNIDFPRFNAKIHISYKEINNNVGQYIEDCRTLAYKHSIKADAIGEKPYINLQNNVYGILYELKGNVASSIQFYTTDSLNHFVRGALYFNNHPNKDSLAPVINFLKEDIKHIIETMNWKK